MSPMSNSDARKREMAHPALSASDLDPALVEKATDAAFFADPARRVSKAQAEAMALAVLTAAAPALRAEGAPWARCTGASDCPEEWHEHGCFSDDCQCSDPNDHDGWDAGYQRGKVDGARQALLDAADHGPFAQPDYRWRRWLRERAEAVARIEGGA